jgi:hypothetical protein
MVFVVRMVLIVLMTYCGLLTWALSYRRRHSLSFWEGMTRASLGLFFISSSFATLSAMMGWDPDLRVTLLLVAVIGASAGLTMTGVRGEENNRLIQRAADPQSSTTRKEPAP